MKWAHNASRVIASTFMAGFAMAAPLPADHPSQPPALQRYQPRPQGTLAFATDIAPIILRQCASCHRPGQSAPFSLVRYDEVKKHARQIADVIQRRYMPPWPPEPGYGEFKDARLLTPEQIGIIQQWAEEGAVEGDPAKTPALPSWPEDWQLGPPDLVVKLPEPYRLAPEGRDVYRNFVIPIPTTTRKYVKAIELNPGNHRAVHHAFIRFDATRQSRRLDEQDPAPGFPGLHTPPSAQSPDGHFLSWQPGKVVRADEALAWPLEKGSDLVLQMHLQPSGKPELVQPSVGFYFTERPPLRMLTKIGLRCLSIDIPAGAASHVVEETFTLPADAEILSVLPHAHFLGKEIQGQALLPDGTRQWLLLIKQWDFNWQGEYRYAQPVALPKGTTILMHYTYDNSTNNARNPNFPPQPVRYGVQSTDEMGELWLQFQLRNTNDLAAFAKAYQPRIFKESIAYNEYLLRLNPNDAKAHSELGKTLVLQGRHAEAAPHLTQASELQPALDDPHFYLGLMHRLQGRLAEAQREFETAARLNPENFKAHGHLGSIYLEYGDRVRAEAEFRAALRINPEDNVARELLEALLKNRPPGK